MGERGRAAGRTQGYAGTWPPREATRAGGFVPSGFGEWSSLLETLRAWVRAEAGAGRLLPWVPIAFGAGIAFYFGADHEPVAWVTAVAAIAFCAAAFLLRRQKIFPIAGLIAAMTAGLASAPPVLSTAPSRPGSRRSLAVCHCAMPPSCRVCGTQSTREYATSWMATSAPSPPRS